MLPLCSIAVTNFFDRSRHPSAVVLVQTLDIWWTYHFWDPPCYISCIVGICYWLLLFLYLQGSPWTPPLCLMFCHYALCLQFFPPMPFILLLCLQSSPYAFCLGTMPSILSPYALYLATLCLQFFSLCLVSCPYAFSCHIYYWWLALPSENTHNHWVPLLHGDHGIAPVPSINPGTCGKPVTFLNVIHAPFTVFVVFYFI